MFYYVYKITNLINGKFYIGVHKTSNLNDGYMGSGIALSRAKDKYGIVNFKKDILIFCDSESDMFEIEELIVDSDFIKRPDVYNVKLGGLGGWDYTNTLFSKDDRIESGRKGGISLKNKLKSDIDLKNRLTSEKSNMMKEMWKNPKYVNIFKNNTGFKGRKHKAETIEKAKKKYAEIGHAQGSKNSQFGTMWIYNPTEKINKKIKKTDEILKGWFKGRKSFK